MPGIAEPITDLFQSDQNDQTPQLNWPELFNYLQVLTYFFGDPQKYSTLAVFDSCQLIS